jgi:hypothetical protein
MSDVMQEIRDAIAQLQPPVVVLNSYVEKNAIYVSSGAFDPLSPPFPRGRRVLFLHPSHRWAAERAGLTIDGVEPRQAAAWTHDPLTVALARLVAVTGRTFRIRMLVRWLSRVLR